MTGMHVAAILERIFGPGACSKTIRLEGKEPSGRVKFCVLDENGEVEICGVTAAEIHDPRMGLMEAMIGLRPESPRSLGVRNVPDPTTPTAEYGGFADPNAQDPFRK